MILSLERELGYRKKNRDFMIYTDRCESPIQIQVPDYTSD